MSKPFSWSMNDSLELANEIIRRHTFRHLDGWSRTTKMFLQNKEKLLKAIDPTGDTGRVVFDVGVFDAVGAMEEINGHIVNELGTRLARINGVRGWHDRVLTHHDVLRGSVSSDSHIVNVLNPTGKRIVRPGMRLTKALRAFIEGVCTDLDGFDIEGFLTEVGSIISQRKVDMHFCVSANPVDILLMSTHSTFSSCHRLEGEYRGAALQYFCDDHTAVAFGWDEERVPDKGLLCGVDVVLPYKRWRQTVHFNLPRQSAYFIRQYSDIGVIDESAHIKIREEAAKILARGAGINLEDLDWKKTDKFDNSDDAVVREDDAPQLAYIDNPASYDGSYKIRLSGGLYRTLYLAESVPCPGCKTKLLVKPGYLVCQKCAEYQPLKCGKCCKYSEDQVELAGASVCRKCAETYSATCRECGKVNFKGRMHRYEVSSPSGETSVSYYCVGDCTNKNLNSCRCCSAMLPHSKFTLHDKKQACDVCFKIYEARCQMCGHAGLRDQDILYYNVFNNGKKKKLLQLCHPCYAKTEQDREDHERAQLLARLAACSASSTAVASTSVSVDINSIPPANADNTDADLDVNTSPF